MSSRTKKIIAVFLVILLVLLVIGGILIWTKKKEPKISLLTGPTVSPSGNLPSLPVAGGGTTIKIENSQEGKETSEKEKTTVEAMARSFAERFGSFSNQSNFENLTDLYPFMTKKMIQWAEDFIATRKGQAKSQNEYFGITTKALATRIISQDKDQITIVVTTQRRESTATTLNNRVYLQDIELKIVKENDLWKVDEAKWKEK
jgi:hypothetical protein